MSRGTLRTAFDDRARRSRGGRPSPLRASGSSKHARFPQPVRPEAITSSRVALPPKPQPPALADPPCLKCRDVCRQQVRSRMRRSATRAKMRAIMARTPKIHRVMDFRGTASRDITAHDSAVTQAGRFPARLRPVHCTKRTLGYTSGLQGATTIRPIHMTEPSPALPTHANSALPALGCFLRPTAPDTTLNVGIPYLAFQQQQTTVCDALL